MEQELSGEPPAQTEQIYDEQSRLAAPTTLFFSLINILDKVKGVHKVANINELLPSHFMLGRLKSPPIVTGGDSDEQRSR